MEALRHDLSYGTRMLFKNAGFTAVAVLSLAIGIGANSAIFSVTNALLLRPLPCRDADRLVILWNRSPGLNIEQDWFSPGQYLDVKSQNSVFEHVSISIGGSFNLTGPGGPEHVDGARVSYSFFPMLSASPMLGRVFLPGEDEPGKPAAVILSHGFWQRRFGSDPEIIGRTLTLNGNNFTIAGVMPAGFAINKEVMPAVNGIEKADLLLPLPMSESARANRGNEDFNIFARLKPGVTANQAQAEMDVIAGRMKEQYPGNYPPGGGLTISVVPLLAQVVGDIGPALPVLFGAVGFVLLIACANVANLVVGVISDAKEYCSEKEPPIAVYYPFEQVAARHMYLVIRTASDPVQMSSAITQEIQAVDPELAVFDVNSMDQRLQDSLARRRFSMILLSVFAAFALMLAAIGIYGVMAYSVNQRTHEIGIRMALGAQRGNILQLVIRQAVILVSFGLAIGLAGAFALTRVMSSLLYGVSATDSFTFVIVSVLLGSTALLASYLPALKATKVDPMVAAEV